MVMDVTGKEVYRKEAGNCPAGNNLVTLLPAEGALKPGVYMLRIHAGTNEWSHRLLRTE